MHLGSMRKNTIPFPIFTSRQSSHKLSSRMNKSKNIKNKGSFGLLKSINEDVKRLKIQNPKKLQKIDKLIVSKQNQKRANTGRRIQQLSLPKNKNIIPTLQINKIQKKQSNRTIIPQTTFRAGKIRKSTALSIEAKNGARNLKFSGQRVIIAKNRKEFTKINEDLIYEVRQNYLNAKFNDRVSRLNHITHENKKIHTRINSQRSHYSTEDLNKSYESNASLSKRLSYSKISRRSNLSISSEKSISSSRYSITSKKSSQYNRNAQCFQSRGALKGKIKQPKKSIKIEEKNINELKVEHLEKFATLFTINKPSQKVKIRSKTTCRHNQSSQFKENVEYEPQLRKKVSINLQQNKCRLPSLSRSSSKNQQTNENQYTSRDIQRVSSMRKRILSTIDQNLVGRSSNSRNNFLHKIIEEPSIPVKNILNLTFKR